MMKTIKHTIMIAGLLATVLPVIGQKQKISSADQLPRRTYDVQAESFMSAMKDEALMNRLASELKTNLLADLNTYEIADAATLKAYYTSLMVLEQREKNFDKLLEYSQISKELSQKEPEKLLSGLGTQAYIAAYKKVGKRTGDTFKNAYKESLADSYSELPYDVVAETLLARRNQFNYLTRDLIVGGIKAQLEPIVQNMGDTWDESIVATLFTYEDLLEEGMDLIPVQVEVINAWEAANKSSSSGIKDFWKDRVVDLSTGNPDITPVVLAVWDTGVDIEVFPQKNRFADKAGKSGIFFDKEGNRSDSMLTPEADLSTPVAELEELIEGVFDLRYNIQSEAADKTMQTIRSLKQDEVQKFQEDTGWYGAYSHGTHVAGIVQDGNPSAKILAARLEYSTKSLPDVPTVERAERWARMFTETVEYFKANKVRVVNMSWRYNSQAYEGALAANGVGGSTEERAELARKIFQIEKDALYTTMNNAPEILFVCGSGNENNDADFAEYIPAGLNLPNLITIGAVDIEGKKASFTTEGESVDYYANGHRIESYVPGGNRLLFSGTSMASPQVANLAGKLIALNPNLSVSEVIELIEEGSDVSDEGIRLINPRKSVDLLLNQ